MNNSGDLRAFSSLPFTSERQPKPRDRGISEICDWGIPHNQLRDYLDHTGEFVDVAKIVLGFAGPVLAGPAQGEGRHLPLKRTSRCSREGYTSSTPPA